MITADRSYPAGNISR